MTRNKRLNYWLDWSLGFCTGMTAGAWRLTHIHGHHIEHKKAKLPSRKGFILQQDSDFSQYTLLKMLRFCLAGIIPLVLGILSCCLKQGYVSKKHFKTQYYRYHANELFGIYSFYLGLTLWQPMISVFFIWIPVVLVLLFSRYIDFITHLKSDDTPAVANDCTSANYNRWFWNFGYHTAHHYRPKLHWSLLPEFHQTIAHSIAPQNLKSYDFSGMYLINHWLIERPAAADKTHNHDVDAVTQHYQADDKQC